MWKLIRSWFVKEIPPWEHFDRMLTPPHVGIELRHLRESNRHLAAENVRMSSEVRSQLDSIRSDVSSLKRALHSMYDAVQIHGNDFYESTPETATCTPSRPVDSQSHPPDSEVPCHHQPETASTSGSQSVPAQMPMGFRLES